MVNTVVHKEEGKEETLRAAISGDADVTIEISTPETNALLQPSSTTSTGVLRNKKQSQEPGIELTKIDRNKKDKIDVDTASSLNTSSSVTPAVECSLRSTAPHCRICLSEGEDGNPIIRLGCSCEDSGNVHKECAFRWFVARNTRNICEICQQLCKNIIPAEIRAWSVAEQRKIRERLATGTATDADRAVVARREEQRCTALRYCLVIVWVILMTQLFAWLLIGMGDVTTPVENSNRFSPPSSSPSPSTSASATTTPTFSRLHINVGPGKWAGLPSTSPFPSPSPSPSPTTTTTTPATPSPPPTTTTTTTNTTPTTTTTRSSSSPSEYKPTPFLPPSVISFHSDYNPSLPQPSTPVPVPAPAAAPAPASAPHLVSRPLLIHNP